MMKPYFILILPLLLLPLSAIAKSCIQTGSELMCDDGSTTEKIGDIYYHSDGSTTQKIGDTYYHSDGSTTQKIGDTYYHSDGSTTQKIGNTYYTDR